MTAEITVAKENSSTSTAVPTGNVLLYLGDPKNGGKLLGSYEIKTNDNGKAIISYTVTEDVVKHGIQQTLYFVYEGNYSYLPKTETTEVTFNALAPAKPEITVQAGNGSATVSWTRPAENGSAIMKYELAVTQNGTAIAESPYTISVAESSYTVNGLTNGMTYEFTLTAINEAGRTASDVVQATPKANTSSSSGGGSSYNRYPVILQECENGTVSFSPTRAERGETVTITIVPDDGYELDMLTVTDSKGNELELTDTGDGKYSFKMPGSKVTVEAVFAKIQESYISCNGGEDCPMWAFTDLDVTEWYHNGIHFCLDEGLMAGTGVDTFSPGETTSRGMIVAILYRLAGSPVVEGENPFTDVVEGQYYRDAVVWATEKGIVSGFGDGTFGPNAPITREQLAVMLYNYAKVFGYDTTVLSAVAQAYRDFEETSAYAETALCWAVDVGIIHGMGDGTLAPQGRATRAEAATMLMNFCKIVVK